LLLSVVNADLHWRFSIRLPFKEDTKKNWNGRAAYIAKSERRSTRFAVNNMLRRPLKRTDKMKNRLYFPRESTTDFSLGANAPTR
jgi:hypothetical protein